MSLRIIYHDRCFDGLASAALFARFWRGHVDADGEVDYAGAHYSNRLEVDPSLFRSTNGDENVILDFKYSSDARVTWWYDHHASAFPTPEDSHHYAAHRSIQRRHDPRSRSCARLIVDTLGTGFGFDASDLATLVEWSDRIDSAAFTSAAEAVELSAAALRIGLVVQCDPDPSFTSLLIEDLQHLQLDEIEQRSYVCARIEGARRAHQSNIEAVRSAARVENDVLVFDVASHPAERIDRFIPFYLYPDVRYGVGLMRSPQGLKVTVSYNPWSRQDRAHDIATVCEETAAKVGTQGAGGHPTIGGIPFGVGEIEIARHAARHVVATLGDSAV